MTERTWMGYNQNQEECFLHDKENVTCKEKIPTYFENELEMVASVEEWKARLNLNDWVIKVSFAEVIPEDIYRVGSCSANYVSKTAKIQILRCPIGETGEDYIKFSHELTLVHELLHCVIFGSALEKDGNTIEAKYYETRVHSELEFIARALISAKYNFSLEWFKEEEEK